jgi:hypothetical protein
LHFADNYKLTSVLGVVYIVDYEALRRNTCDYFRLVPPNHSGDSEAKVSVNCVLSDPKQWIQVIQIRVLILS